VVTAIVDECTASASATLAAVSVTTSRKRLPELLLACGSVLLFLALLVGAELFLRWADPRYLDRTRSPTIYSEHYGWAYRAGAKASMHGVWTTINSRGYRGEEHPREKTPGRTRIVMLGDSVLFGPQVTDEETFASLLESRTRRYEVINLGVEGYGTDQELLLLEREALGYEPDLVILNFFIDNDVQNNALSWDQSRFPKPYFTLEDDQLRLHDEHLKLSAIRRMAQWLQDHSHLYGRIYPFLPAPRKRRVATASAQSSADANEVTARVIQRMDEVARQAGARLFVLLHPNQPAFARPSRLSIRLRRAPLLEGIPILDLGERYRARELWPRDVLLDYQGHLSQIGHRVAVQEIEMWFGNVLGGTRS
jgi:hypothetical protein